MERIGRNVLLCLVGCYGSIDAIRYLMNPMFRENQYDALEGCSLVAIIVELLTRNWIVQVQHIFRENNMVIDRVVALCRGGPVGVVEMSQVPRSFFDLVQKEASEG
ncbi:hypothetical protein V6N12_002691 [Hibiscus sabdariffa]|uniref:RNase H type-1 domain-containing protein n=1 Tax=Hibiscus sabdariffa TaxID=183260 RepID=A0ABR2E9Q0_9ROSI